MTKLLESLVPGAVLMICVALAPCGATALAAGGASTVTPNLLTYLVSKDIGVERWVVSLNVSPSDPTVVVNVTGNVFKSDGSPPSFVVCRPRDDSQGTLADPASSFHFVCDGADACPTTARECARTSWSRISDDVALQSQFFLPAPGTAAAAPATAGVLDRLVRSVPGIGRWLRVVTAWQPSLLPRAAEAQTNDRGATLSSDGLSYLVNKDLAGERWSIGLSYLPARAADGSVANQLEGITGNVLRGADAPPTFIFCTVRDDSTGTLDDPTSSFRLSCQGGDGCSSSAEECARSGWTTIADDISVPASFFLPPGGLPAKPQSDPDIVVIGRTSDPPSYETADYTTPGGSTTARAAAATCDVGAACLANRIGSCTEVEGRLVSTDDGCRCRIDDVDPACITCAGGSAQCGSDCEFPIGDATARGICLPASSSRPDCICYGIGAGSSLRLQQCGGALAGQCPDGRCCSDDPRDGCTADAAAGCSGVCVAGSCAAGDDSCGSCFVVGPTPIPTVAPTPSPGSTATATPRPTSAATVTPGPTRTSPPPPTATPAPTSTPPPTAGATATPRATATPAPTQTSAPTQTPHPTATPVPSCGDGHVDPGEQCEPYLGNTGCSGQRCSSVTCQCFTCSPQTLREDNGQHSVVDYDLGISVGTFDFTYNAFQNEYDQFIVRYEGTTLFDSGCILFGSTMPLTINGESTKIEVEVNGACIGEGGSWEYTVACPQ